MQQLTMLARGLLRRCPNCGEPSVFSRWVTMVPRCPRCGLYFERVEGYWTGAMGLNIVATEMVFFLAIIVGVVVTWPDIPTIPLLAVGLAVNGIFPVIFYPISKTLWVALDLILHPLESDELHEVDRLRRLKDHAPSD